MNLKKLITIILCAIVLNLTIVSSNEDDELEDFDFESLTDSDYNSENSENDDKLGNFFDTKDDFGNQLQNAFDLKEKAIRTALSKALTNKVLRQKFVEVMPILRVLSSQQRLALSALISAQISAKPGTELKLEQVKQMFGDSRKLIIPLMFDIANLVKTAAKNSLHYVYDFYAEKPQQMPISASRRNFEVTSEDKNEPNDDVIFVSKGEIDPLMINEQLYRVDGIQKSENIENQENHSKHIRRKRSCSYPCPLFNENQKGSIELKNIQATKRPIIENRSFHNQNLNASNFISSFSKNIQATINNRNVEKDTKKNFSPTSTKMPYEEVEDLALLDVNGTLSSSSNLNRSIENSAEKLPTPESLIGGRRQGPNKINGGRMPPPRSFRTKIPPKKCEKFTSSMCIKVEDYPTDLIMGSIRRHKHAMSALLAEFRDKTAEAELEEYQEEYELKRRGDDGENELTPGGMCQSVVKFARPQKARSASGEWKYIVNTGQHTQTLRLEKCSQPHGSCSYLSENFRSRCIQIYNYHRLLSWDKTRGLHVEIFKVPICCACHVDGYRDTYPPGLSTFTGKIKDLSTLRTSKPNFYSTFDEDEIDEEELEEAEDSIAYQYGNGFKKIKPNKYASEFISGSGIHKNRYDGNKIQKIPSAFGSSINPPSGPYDLQYNFKRGPNLSSGVGNYLNNVGRQRRPLQAAYETDDRADQDYAESEIDKEVTIYPTIDKTVVRPKRKHTSSVTTATQKPESFSSKPTTSVRSATSPKNFHNFKTTKSDVNKRINYNYHPIIDFFEEQSNPLVPSKKQKRIEPNLTKNSRLRHEDDNSWRPIIME